MEDNEQALGVSVLDALGVFDKRSYPKDCLNEFARMHEPDTQDILDETNWKNPSVANMIDMAHHIGDVNAPTLIRILAVGMRVAVDDPVKSSGVGLVQVIIQILSGKHAYNELISQHLELLREPEISAIGIWVDWLNDHIDTFQDGSIDLEELQKAVDQLKN